jgi:hypothetical protein
MPGGIKNIVGTIGKDTVQATKSAVKNVANTGYYVKQAYEKGTEKQGVAQIKTTINDIIKNPSFKFLRPDVQNVINSVQRYFVNSHLPGKELEYIPAKLKK